MNRVFLQLDALLACFLLAWQSSSLPGDLGLTTVFAVMQRDPEIGVG